MRTIHRDIVGAFIFSADNKLLVGKSRKGGVYPNAWIIPGGGIDEGESQLDALRREIMEETGIDISNAKVEQIDGALTGESEKTLKETNELVMVEMTFFNYLVKLDELANEVKTYTDDDFVEPYWANQTEIKNLELSPPTITTLQRLGWL